MDRSGGSRLRPVATAAGAALLVAIVAIGADLRPATSPGGALAFDPQAIARVMVPLLRFGYLAVLVAAFYRWLVAREARPRRRGGGRPPSLLATFLALCLIALGVFVFSSTAGETPPATTTTLVRAGTGAAPRPGQVRPAVVEEPGWVLVALAVTGLAGLAAIAARRAGGSSSPVPSPGSPLPAVMPSSRDLPVGGDTRARVFAAYRRVEAAAGARGLARAGHETVASHLQRLERPAPGDRLTMAYHAARFSPFEVTEGMAASAESAASELERGLA